MPDPLLQLAQDVERSLNKLDPTLRSRVGADLVWAVFNLRAARMGRAIVEHLVVGPSGFRDLQTLFPEEWDVLEVAAMSLAFEDTMTALDLLANAVYVACGGTPSASGAYKDLGYWTPTRIAAVTQANTKRWLDAVTTSADLSLLKTCRDALTHRSVTRLVSMGGGVGRSVVEIAERPVPGSAATAPLGGIDVLIPNVLTFGEQQLQACSAALRADFGT